MIGEPAEIPEVVMSVRHVETVKPGKQMARRVPAGQPVNRLRARPKDQRQTPW